jgi:hypothetical protein
MDLPFLPMLLYNSSGFLIFRQHPGGCGSFYFSATISPITGIIE